MSKSPITFCISSHNNLPYLKIAVESVRNNSFFKDAPFIVQSENSDDGTDEWLETHYQQYDIDYYITKSNCPMGIGGGMNFVAEKVETEYIMFLHADFYVTKNWDIRLLEVMNEHTDEKLWVNSWRVEPQMFPNSQTRPGTIIVPKETFGAYHNDFNSEAFDEWVKLFVSDNDESIPKGEGVSGLIKKEHWDEIGGNDPLFAPASYDDMDLFLRMQYAGFKFIQPTKSVVWHFGARGSHRLEENDGKSSERQQKAERDNIGKWLGKWGALPKLNEYGMIIGLEND
jgi:GT2 family glycosyltransferase